MACDLSGWDNQENLYFSDIYESDKPYHKSEHKRNKSDDVLKSLKKVSLLYRRNQPENKVDKTNWKYFWKKKDEVSILTANSFCKTLLNRIPAIDEPLKKLTKKKLEKSNKKEKEAQKLGDKVHSNRYKVSVINVLEKFDGNSQCPSKMKEEMSILDFIQKDQKLTPIIEKVRNSRSTFNTFKNEHPKKENKNIISRKENCCLVMSPYGASCHEMTKVTNFLVKKIKKSTSDYLPSRR